MSDAEKPQSLDDEQEEIVSAYVPPPQKSIGELIAADQEDESLRKYKEALLGNAVSEAIVIGRYLLMMANSSIIDTLISILIRA